MIRLNLPEYQFKLRKDISGKVSIFDEIQKKYRILTPEEWVRQNIIKYLISEKQYPAGLISIESGIKVNTMARRYDLLIYNQMREPIVLIECKAPEVKITQKAFDQVYAYNEIVKSKNIFVSNGLTHFFCRINQDRQPEFLNTVPNFQDL